MNYKITFSYFARLASVLNMIGRGKNFLNVGSGSGDYNYYLKDKFKLNVGLEYNKHDLSLANALKGKAKIRYVRGDAHHLPFKSNLFDRVICIDVLEHVKDHERCLKEIHRVMQKGGKLILTVPNKEFPFVYDPINYLRIRVSNKHYNFGAYGYGHLRLFTEKDLLNDLKRAGFKIKLNKRLSFFLIALSETYIIGFISKFLKTNYDNVNRSRKVSREKFLHYNYNFPGLLRFIWGLVVKVDSFLFRWSKKSMNILVIAEK